MRLAAAPAAHSSAATSSSSGAVRRPRPSLAAMATAATAAPGGASPLQPSWRPRQQQHQQQLAVLQPSLLVPVQQLQHPQQQQHERGVLLPLRRPCAARSSSSSTARVRSRAGLAPHRCRRHAVAAAASSAAAADFPGRAGQEQQQQQQQPSSSSSSSAPSSSAWQPPQRARGALPRVSLWQLGGPLAWGYMLAYLTLMLVLPISALLAKASLVPLAEFVARATEPVALSAYYVSFSMALVAGVINCLFGFLLAWVLVKYEFPGKKWIDAAVDLPFALPTSVAGLTLATVYGEEGILGRLLMAAGVDVVYTRLGVAVAMVFVSFPFVVRTIQPVLQEMEKEVEEAAWSLGASSWQTFVQVLLPPLLPPLLTGTALAFSRALGEFGSVVIVSSNFPFKDLIAPVLIFQCLEQYDFVGATVIGTVLLLISLVMMVGVNWLQSYSQRFRK